MVLDAKLKCPMCTWVTHSGKMIEVFKLKTDHLLNIIKFIKLKNSDWNWKILNRYEWYNIMMHELISRKPNNFINNF